MTFWLVPRAARSRCKVAVILLALLASSTAVTALTDRDILEAFYVTCKGDNWVLNTNWLDDQVSICEWEGIECTEVGDQVEKIRLPSNNLTCSLPSFLFTLQGLEWLDLRENAGISADFTSLDASSAPSSLQYLVLSDTNLASVEGIEFFASTLTTLFLAGCNLSGPFPQEILQLTALRNLDLSYNLLSSTIPDGLDALMDLRTLSLSHNFFSGQMPPTLGNLTKITNMQLQFNQISGTLPPELGNLEDLTFLSLNNQIQGTGNAQVGGITGPLIDFGSAEYLFHINLSNNKLNGAIPSTFLSNLTVDFGDLILLDLTANGLTGAVPVELGRFDMLQIYLSDNKIQAIPTVLCQETDWLGGSVGQFGCNAILCPPGTFNSFGRQTSVAFPCSPCSAIGASPYFGARQCEFSTLNAPPLNNTVIYINTTGHRPLQRLSKNRYFPLLKPEKPYSSGSNDEEDWRQGHASLLEYQDALSASSTPSICLFLWLLVPAIFMMR